MTDLLEGIDVPVGRREIRAVLLRAVASDHGAGAGLTVAELIALACTHGLRTEAERSAAIDAALHNDEE